MTTNRKDFPAFEWLQEHDRDVRHLTANKDQMTSAILYLMETDKKFQRVRLAAMEAQAKWLQQLVKTMNVWERDGYPANFEAVVAAAKEQADTMQRRVEELRSAREGEDEVPGRNGS